MAAAEGARPIFPNYLQMRRRVPLRVWHVGRVLSVTLALGECVLLIVRPELGLDVFWGFFIPLLPLVFFVAPGLWRNLCPLAALNQTPRLLRFTRGLTLPPRMKEYGYVVGICLFLLIVPARKALFNENGAALAGLLLAALGAAFVGGTIFKGKSGWCSSICPLLPVQRVYGQTPFVTLPNSHCQPCVGCTKNCYDFNPAVAYLADLYDEDRHYSGYRKFFVGAFPGLILAFYTVADPPEISVPVLYGQFALFVLGSVGLFYALESFVKVTANKITVLFGAAALNLYYWYNVPRVADRLFEDDAPEWLVWLLRLGVLALTGVWVIRTYLKERSFVAQASGSRAVRLATSEPIERHRQARSGQPELTVMPEGRRIAVEPGRTLLEIVESNDLPIEAGCRMGMCGADPVAVLEGAERLSAVGAEERATLERLGFAENTRMACCARVQGPVSIALEPERAPAGARTSVPAIAVDTSVARVVIVGNGIAGVTAADHVGRLHPDCEVVLIGNEPHHLYNRMAISRLIYGRSAMQGLYLMPEAWYDERRIACWLNTRAVQIDPEARSVVVGTGEALPYDRLVLAMGSSGAVPPVDGFGIAGSFVLRQAEDAMRMRAFVQEHAARHAVVAGGGLLGLEAAYALHKLGLHVSILERSEWLLRRQLDERAATLLRSYLESLGLEVLLDVESAAVRGNGRVAGVELKDGRTLAADLYLLCAGVSPNVALAREAGLEVERGVVVDDHMRTSAEDVYAAGDVAQHRGQTYGLWPAAVEQAEVAAVNAVGGDRRYEGTVPVTILKVVGVDLTSIGRFEPASDEDEAIVVEDAGEHRYRKLVISDGKVVGAILLGHPLDAPAVTAAVKGQLDVGSHLDALRAGDWDVLGRLEADEAPAPSPAA